MSLLKEILAWTISGLTDWQRDAIRRLFQKQTLNEQDYIDLYAMLKSSHGILDSQNRKPIPFSQSFLPAQVESSAPVIIQAMRDLKDVNLIGDGENLKFSAKGMTLIYGGNGSGKSGYSRVLKQACRARDVLEVVHPNAFDLKAVHNIPEAIFDVLIDEKVKSIAWRQGQEPPDELSTIAVFDCRCARTYLNSERDVAYLPYGLDIVENLGQEVLPQLMQRLNAEIANISVDTTSFADLLGDTVVGKTISSLSEKTDPTSIVKLATLEEDERKRLNALEKMLSENDPKTKAKSIRILAGRIDSLISRINAVVTYVGKSAIETLIVCDSATEVAIKAESIAVENFRKGEQLLLGTGDEAWKLLFESARRFSTEVAYPKKPFPNTESGSKCPLCQQILDEKAVQRMRRFEDFVKQEASKVSREKQKQRESAKKYIADATLSLGLDTAILEELKQLDDGLPNLLQEFDKKIEVRKGWILNALKTHVWSNYPSIEDDPRMGLKGISSKLILQAEELERSADEKQRKALNAECSELRVRNNLATRHKAILDLIQRMKIKAKLEECKDDLKTRVISDKAKEFASRAVTTALKNALDTEFQRLGVGHIKTKLNERVEQAKMKHKLLLDLPMSKKIDEILSEGEQRAIAIGSFLAELHLSGHKGGIVFDDPVSSLDHYRRKDVALRLVEESKTRQVIILTHDTAFLGELRDMIEQQDADCLTSFLEWKGGKPGHVCCGLPWDHKTYNERLDIQEKNQKYLENSWQVYPSEENKNNMRHEYNFLRATIERVIQDVVFSGVIRRYRDWIKVSDLSNVVGFSNIECKEILRLHKRCCDVISAHDSSSVKNASVPTAVELGEDIVKLKQLIEIIKSRRKLSA
ncbi:MAG: AAA family ATPase [Nanoarchaeota archaeon]|nr:AAA family ATPase [Nanoarchaeota archaeon]